MYHVTVLHCYICEGRSFLLNHALRLSTVLTTGSGWQHCDFQIMIRETNEIVDEYILRLPGVDLRTVKFLNTTLMTVAGGCTAEVQKFCKNLAAVSEF